MTKNAQQDHDDCDHGHDPANRWPARSLAVAASLNVAAVLMQVLRLQPAAARDTIAGVAIVLGGWFLLPGAWRAVARLRPNVNLLMVVATVGAAIIGEWVEAATVVVLFGVAEWLEDWADRRSHRAVRALLELAPHTARVKSDGGVVDQRVEEISVGAVIVVRNGERIPLDGEVVSGSSSVNQAPITGESRTVPKKRGDTVYAGSINGGGSLEVNVAKEAGDTTLARIIRLVEEAQKEKAPAQRFVDVFARYYTPAVAAAALLVFIVPPLLLSGDWSTWLYRACVLLVIACPCALVIATPVGVVAGLTALARRGVLVKGGAHLEAIGRLRAIAIDKTGTLTRGEPRVLAVEGIGSDGDEALRTAAAIDVNSSHPFARAIVDYASSKGIKADGATGFITRDGRGAEGRINGRTFFVGNHRFAHELGVCSTELEERLAKIEVHGYSAIVVGQKPSDEGAGSVLGIVTVGDELRPGAREAVAALHARGIKSIVMLSGDNQRTVDSVARELGIDQARGDLLPEDKVKAVRELTKEHGVVAMVGDGVNDAPALAAATVGIAMGAAGSDAAIETADIALMRDDLSMISSAVDLGSRTLGIVRFNIGFALALKALFLGLAIAGVTSLWLAILADTGATLLVIANSLRVLRSQGEKHRDEAGEAKE